MKKAKKLKPAKAKEMAKALAGMGTGDDSMLIHVEPWEAELLHKVTDGGKINPNTGLPAFDDFSDGGDWAGSGWGWSGDDGTGNDGGSSMSDGTNVSNAEWRDNQAADMAGQGWDTSTSDGSNARGAQIANEQSFGSSVGRGIGNSVLGYIGLHNPGPQARGNGMMASPGYGFNPGALAGSYLGLATGTPFMGELGARGYNAAMGQGAPSGGQVAGFNLTDNDNAGPLDPRMARALIGA